MDRKSIAMLLVVTSSITSTAFATSILNKLTNKHSTASSITKTHVTTRQTNQSFIDFSGNWIGNCGEDENFSVSIENGADSIIIGNEHFRIGQGLQGKSDSSLDSVQYEYNSLEWSADGAALIMKNSEASKENIPNSVIETVASYLTLTMKNGQIHLDGKMSAFQDGTQSDSPYAVHCVFSKKQ